MLHDWEDYDPRWLAELANASQEVIEYYPWLPDALLRCTRYRRESVAYIHFVDSSRPNEPGSQWQFDINVVLDHAVEGELVLCLLKNQRVGGVEFLSRISEVE